MTQTAQPLEEMSVLVLYGKALRLLKAPGPYTAGEAKPLLEAAADAGYPYAQRKLALCLLVGNVLSQNLAEAAHWFSTASTYFPEAGLEWANAYFEGINGFPKDEATANRIYQVVAESKNSDCASRAKCELGRNYLLGHGVEKNMPMAERLLRESIDLSPNGPAADHFRYLFNALFERRVSARLLAHTAPPL